MNPFSSIIPVAVLLQCCLAYSQMIEIPILYSCQEITDGETFSTVLFPFCPANGVVGLTPQAKIVVSSPLTYPLPNSVSAIFVNVAQDDWLTDFTIPIETTYCETRSVFPPYYSDVPPSIVRINNQTISPSRSLFSANPSFTSFNVTNTTTLALDITNINPTQWVPTSLVCYF